MLFGEVNEIQMGLVRLYSPDWISIDWRAVALALLSCLLTFGSNWSVLRVLGIAALGGLVLGLAS